jgi:hypothetical protein
LIKLPSDDWLLEVIQLVMLKPDCQTLPAFPFGWRGTTEVGFAFPGECLL